MKILMVTRENHADKRYGLGKSLLPIVESLESRGHEVRYLCQADLGRKGIGFLHGLHRRLAPLLCRLSNGDQLLILLWGILERFNMGRLAAKLAAREEFTHVHCHDPLIAQGYRLFAFFTRGCVAKWGVTQHGFGCYAQAIHEDGARMGTRLMRWMRKMEANTLIASGWVICPTHAALHQLARDLSVYPIPPQWRAVTHPRPQLNSYAKKDARAALGWESGLFYVLGIGRFAPLKQFPLLIEACARQHGAGGVQLVLLGEGDVEAMQNVAAEAGLARPVMFAVTDDVGMYLAAADVYVSTSATESFGMANLEALLAGTPAICTAVGGVPEVMGDGAWLVPPALDAIASALQGLRENEPMRTALGARGRRRGQTWPEVEEIASLYEQIYREAEAT